MASQIVDASVAGDCATEFTCFPRLPTELRLKIWRIICNTGRDLWIGTTYYRNTSEYSKLFEDEKEDTYLVFRYYTFSLPPVVLHVNHESRFEGLKYYTLAFGSGYKSAGHIFETSPRTYVNFQVDRICPHVKRMTLNSTPWELMVEQPIRCLAFPWNYRDDPNHYFDFFAMMAGGIETYETPFFLKNIEEFTLYDPEILKGPTKDLPKERSQEAMSFTYYDLCYAVLGTWAGESICYPIDDESCWQVVKGTLGGLRKTVVVNGERDRPPWRRCFNSLLSPPAEQKLKVPAVKIVELNEGNAEKYIGVTNLPIYEKLRARFSEKSNL